MLFEDLTFSISQGECVGLVGRNGSGKSTLLKIIMGKETSDSGDVSTPKGYKLGYLDQHINFTHETVLMECCSALPEEEQYDFYKAERILFGLGFKEEDMDRNPSEFSGGFQLRMNLCKTLLGNPDLLLLDEPTNYLDILSLRWMRKFLKTFKGESILITHDRGFMDSVTSHTMGLHRSGLKKIKGDTEKFYTQIEEEEIIHEKTRLNQQKKIDHMQSFVDRFRAQATKAKQAQSRLKQIGRMEVSDALTAEQELGFRFNYKDTHAKTILRAKNLSFGWEPGELLFDDLSFELEATDRIGIIGKNGKGKTTLLSAIAGKLPHLSGERILHNDGAVGYYEQTNKKDLDPNKTIADEISATNPKLTITQNRGICGAMMFSGDDAEKKVGVLSGGEQARVLLGQIIATPYNVLLLDEPTNHLDMSSVESLIGAIHDFDGAVVVVTHNEGLLRATANKLIIFQDGETKLFDGNYDEFIERIGWSEENETGSAPKKVNSKKEQRREQAEAVQDRSRVIKPLQRDLQKMEDSVMKWEESLASQQKEVIELSALTQPTSPQRQKLTQLLKDSAALQTKIDEGFEKMLTLSDEIKKLTGE